MGNFALQTSPCSFLKLHISPWGIPFIFLLCSLSLSPLSSSGISIPHRQHSPNLYPLSLSVSFLTQQGLGGARQARTGAASGSAWEWAARGSVGGRAAAAAAGALGRGLRRARRAARLARGAGVGGAGAAQAGASWRAQGGAPAVSGGARE
jgi:hypothetical protein